MRRTEVVSRNNDEVLVHRKMVAVKKEDLHLHVDKLTMMTMREKFETTVFWTDLRKKIGIFRAAVMMRMILEVVDLCDQHQLKVHANIKIVVIIIGHHLQNVIIPFLQ